jgi:hypothetical protein
MLDLRLDTCICNEPAQPKVEEAPERRSGRRCGHKVRAGARIVSLLVFRLWAENDCSPGFKAV